jgi:uncharacterized membrane protein (Fun14 family)
MPIDIVAFQLGVGVRRLGVEIGTGAVIGGLIGFAAKKVAKLIAILVGLELALFKFLETRGILEVNWSAISGVASNTTSAATEAGSQPPGWVTSLLSALPVSAGFTGGFLLGFRKG